MLFNNNSNLNEHDLIFIPGGPWISGAYWDHYLKGSGLSNSHRYILLNHESRYSSSECSLDDLVLDLENYILEVSKSGRPTILIGHSYGAWIILLLNERIKKLVKKVIFVSIPLEIKNLELSNKIAQLNLPPISSNKTFKKYFSSIFKLYFFNETSSKDAEYILEGSYMQGNESLIITQLQIEKLRNKINADYIFGENDQIIHNSFLNLSKAHIIKNCGHFPMIEQPVIFSEVLKNCIK